MFMFNCKIRKSKFINMPYSSFRERQLLLLYASGTPRALYRKRYSGCLHGGGKMMMVATARFVYPASVVVLTKTRIVIRINAFISDSTNVQKYLSALKKNPQKT